MIDRISFDHKDDVLCVTFQKTGKYRDYGVPAATFETFCNAPAGTFFKRAHRGPFRCRRDPERRRFGPNA